MNEIVFVRLVGYDKIVEFALRFILK